MGASLSCLPPPLSLSSCPPPIHLLPLTSEAERWGERGPPLLLREREKASGEAHAHLTKRPLSKNVQCACVRRRKRERERDSSYLEKEAMRSAGVFYSISWFLCVSDLIHSPPPPLRYRTFGHVSLLFPDGGHTISLTPRSTKRERGSSCRNSSRPLLRA